MWNEEEVRLVCEVRKVGKKLRILLKEVEEKEINE